MTLRERIKDMCKCKGISMNALEKELGFASGYISKLDKSTPNSKNIQKIADYFGVSVDYLMTGEDNTNGDTYYLNDETRQIAQEIYANPEMRSLFDMSRKMSPERLKAHVDFMKKLYEQERPEC